MLHIHRLTDSMCPNARDKDSVPHKKTIMVTIKFPAALSLLAKAACLVSTCWVIAPCRVIAPCNTMWLMGADTAFWAPVNKFHLLQWPAAQHLEGQSGAAWRW